MSNSLLFTSIIIPCRNEEKYIGKCLDSVLATDFPKEKMEIFVVDGMSQDKTRKIVRDYTEKYSFVRLLDNPKKFIPFALNIGIKQAKGEIIIRLDAHASYEKDYISKCLKYLKEYNADNVGGTMKTLPAKDSITAKAIARVLSHPFGAASSFRVGLKKPRLVDTVFGGCYKREVFKKIGLFNENLLGGSEDMEFNLRLKKAGGKIVLVPDIVSYYYPKSNLRDFFIHNFKDGFWAIYPIKSTKTFLKLRHYIPLFFVTAVLASLILGPFFFLAKVFFVFLFGSYLLASLYFSLIIAIKNKEFRFLFLMPLVFSNRHFSYGLGSVWGAIKIITPKI